MSASNKTANYELPQFAQTDQPTWLGDFNNAMDLIDKGMAKAGVQADTAVNAANNAVLRVSTVESGVTEAKTVAQAAQATANSAKSDADALGNTVKGQASSIAAIQTYAQPVKRTGSATIGGGTVTWETIEVPLTHQMTVWLGIDAVKLDKQADVQTYPVFTLPLGKRFDHNIQLLADADLATPASLIVTANATSGVVSLAQGQGINPRAYTTDCVFTYNY